MRNECRAEILNLTNATDNRLAVTLSVSGLPGGQNPPYLSVRDVLFTDRFKNSMRQLQNPLAIRETRRALARRLAGSCARR